MELYEPKWGKTGSFGGKHKRVEIYYQLVGRKDILFNPGYKVFSFKKKKHILLDAKCTNLSVYFSFVFHPFVWKVNKQRNSVKGLKKGKKGAKVNG